MDSDPLEDAERLIAEGRPQDAAARLEALHAAGRGGMLLQAARVRAAIAAGDAQSALAIGREAAMLYPTAAVAVLALGDALLAAGHLATAIGEYQRALRVDPDSSEARFRLGAAWLEAGEAEKAAEALADVSGDDVPELDAKLAEIEAMRERARCDPRYVRHLFDQFSADYDARMLEHLSYGAPSILRGLADMLGVGLREGLAILDLGCGTGLGGAAFYDLAARLDGVDLSPAMIEKARARGIYDDLAVADIEFAPGAMARRYDLIIAADTLVYLGDLVPLFRAAAQRLAPDGLFLFTVERKTEGGFELGPKRRWRHGEAYLRDAAAVAGLDVSGLMECHPRREAGVPVEGFAVALALAENGG